GVLAFIATLGGPQELSLLLDRVVAGASRSIAERTRLLEALEQATRQRNVRPAGDLARLLPLLKEDNEGLLTVAARVSGLWKLAAARPQLLEMARANNSSDGVRQAAVDGLAALGG